MIVKILNFAHPSYQTFSGIIIYPENHRFIFHLKQRETDLLDRI